MKSFFISTIAVLSFASAASADIIKCTFTEPFIDVVYSTTTNELTTTTPFGDGDKDSVEVQKNVSFQIKGPGQFELLDSQKKVVMKLDLNFKGSNGMSDHVYPYDVQLVQKNLWGGCSSNFLKTVLPEGGAH